MPSPTLSQSAARLRSELGATMASARRHILALLKPHRLNQRFESDTLLRLMRHQPPPARVNAKHIRQFVRQKRPPHNNVCLFAVLRTGHVADVSWLKAVRNLYGRHDKAVDSGRKAISAFRNEAHHTPKMREARSTFTVGPCAECRQRRKLAIDHAGQPFAQILDEFIREQRASDPQGSLAQATSMGTIPLAWSNGAYVLADRLLSKRWRDWHEARARLVGVCRRCNSSKGSGGYRYSSFRQTGGDEEVEGCATLDEDDDDSGLSSS